MDAVTELEREAFRVAHEQTREARQDARTRRAEAIRAAEDAGIPREAIAEAAGIQWPVSRQRWSVLRRG